MKIKRNFSTILLFYCFSLSLHAYANFHHFLEWVVDKEERTTCSNVPRQNTDSKKNWCLTYQSKPNFARYLGGIAGCGSLIKVTLTPILTHTLNLKCKKWTHYPWFIYELDKKKSFLAEIVLKNNGEQRNRDDLSSNGSRSTSIWDNYIDPMW